MLHLIRLLRCLLILLTMPVIWRVPSHVRTTTRWQIASWATSTGSLWARRLSPPVLPGPGRSRYRGVVGHVCCWRSGNATLLAVQGLLRAKSGTNSPVFAARLACPFRLANIWRARLIFATVRSLALGVVARDREDIVIIQQVANFAHVGQGSHVPLVIWL